MVNTDSLKAKQITQTHAIAWEDAHYRIHSLLRSECNVDFRRVKKKMVPVQNAQKFKNVFICHSAMISEKPDLLMLTVV